MRLLILRLCPLLVCSHFSAVAGCAAPGADCRASKCCQKDGHTCFEKNPYWGSCKMSCTPGIDPNDPPEYQDEWSCKVLGSSPAPPPPPEVDPVDPPRGGDPHLTYMSGNLGHAKTTRYWDCCKPSCAWPDKARVSKPVKVCDKDGSSPLGSNSKNVCGGGGSGKGPCYMCSAQQPWYDAQRKVSFGFAAGVVKGVPETGSCCACYELHFEKSSLPRMVVQIGNTGGDLGDNQFDIQVPGGGFGIFDGCTKQFDLPSKTSWGARYGGIMAAGLGKAGCERLPKKLRPGCEFTFDHLGDNPKVSSFYRVACPAEISAKTGCIRADDAKTGAAPERRRGKPAPTPAPDDGRRRRRSSPKRRRRRRSSGRRRSPGRRRSARRRR